MTTRRRPVVVMVGCETFAVRPGGLNRYHSDLAEALAPTWRVRRVLPGDRFREQRWMPGPLVLVARTAVAAFRTARALRGSDLVDIHFSLYGWPASVLAPLFGTPVVVHFQGPWATESEVANKGGQRARAVKQRLEAFVYRRAAACVVLSEAFRDLLAQEYGVDPAKIRVIRPGVDLARFVPRGATTPRAVFAARRLDPRMGLDVAVEAWPEVVSVFPDAVLSIAGDGAQRTALVEQVNRLGLTDSVVLLGRVSDEALLAGYQSAELSIVPTRALEGFGLAALEALACGTPTIVSDVDALPEFMREFDPTMVVPRDDIGALSARVVAALGGDRPSRAECRAFAATMTWERTATAHDELYRAVIATTARTTGGAPMRVTMVALEWPTTENEGGGVARLNYRIAEALLAGGTPVVIVTFEGGRPLAGAETIQLARPRGRLGRYYVAPLRAARVVGRRPIGAVLALGDDWAMPGVRRSRVYTGASRSEARNSSGLRRVNHWVLAALEYVNSLDRSTSNWTIGPDLPRNGLVARTYPPLPGLRTAAAGDVGSDRQGIAFVGPPGGRKRGDLALRVARESRAVDESLTLDVYTARAADAASWSGARCVHVGLDDTALAGALRHHAFLLSTSSYEGYGIPVVEAMANGCVPVVTDTPGARTILVGELSQLIGPTDEAQFLVFAVDLMTRLRADGALFRRVQHSCWTRAAAIVLDADPIKLVTV